MSWAAVAGGGIAAIGAIGSAAMSSQGSSSGSQSNQVSPASWESLGSGASDLWSDFVDQFSGKYNVVPDALGSLPPEQQEEVRNALWQRKQAQDFIDMKQSIGDAGREDLLEIEDNQRKVDFIDDFLSTNYPQVYAKSPSLQDKMNEDYDYQRQTGEDFLGEMGTAGAAMKAATAANTGNYQGTLDQISQRAATPFMRVSLGGPSPVDIISKRQLGLADTLSQVAKDRFGAGGIMNQTNYDMDSGSATRALQQGMQFTPNGADVNYFDKLWPIIQALQANRFQTPSATQTASVTPGMSLAERMNQIAKAGQSVASLWNSFNRNPQPQPYSQADINAGNYTPV